MKALYELTIIQSPGGRWILVGTGPATAFYTGADGAEVSAQLIDSQMRLPASYRTIKTRAFESADDAFEYLKAKGLSAAYRP